MTARSSWTALPVTVPRAAPKGILAWWYRATQLGVPAGMPPLHSRYVVLTNAAALLALAMTWGFSLEMWSAGALPVHLLLTLAQALVWMWPLILNALGRHRVATVVLELGGVVVFGGQAALLGAGYGHHFFFVLYAAAPLVLHPPRQDRLMYAMVAVGFSCFVGLESLGSSLTAQLPPYPAQVALLLPLNMAAGVFVALVALAAHARGQEQLAQAQVQREQAKADAVLLNILPPDIARRLKENPQTIADAYSNVTVLFADITGFTQMSERRPRRAGGGDAQ